jgi:hypothetical protein
VLSTPLEKEIGYKGSSLVGVVLFHGLCETHVSKRLSSVKIKSTVIANNVFTLFL